MLPPRWSRWIGVSCIIVQWRADQGFEDADNRHASLETLCKFGSPGGEPQSDAKYPVSLEQDIAGAFAQLSWTTLLIIILEKLNVLYILSH